MTVTAIDPVTALVAIDLQEGIVASTLSPYTGKEVVARTTDLAEAFRAAGLPVVLVRVSFAPDFADVPPGRTEGAGGGARPAGWDVIVAELAGHPGDLRVTKHNWGAFHGTDLDVQLRRRGVTQIVLTGIATTMGVESTARAAHEHGYNVTLAVDAMADRDGDAHAHSIRHVFPKLGETGTTDEILALLAGSVRK